MVEDMEEDGRNKKWENGQAKKTRSEAKAKSSVVYKPGSEN